MNNGRDRYSGRRSMDPLQKELPFAVSNYQSWVEWLSTIPWTTYGTFTFQDDQDRSVWSLGDRIIQQLWRTTGCESFGFIVGEHGRRTGRFHLHGLLAHDKSGLQLLDEYWREYYGLTRFEPFQRGRGAEAYCGKYTLKEAYDTGEYTVSGSGGCFDSWASYQKRPWVRDTAPTPEEIEKENKIGHHYKENRRQEKTFASESPEAREKLISSHADSWWIDRKRMSGYDRYLEEMRRSR